MDNNQLKYNNLREKFPLFYFDDFQYEISSEGCVVQYFFHTGEYHFQPKMRLECGKYMRKSLDSNKMKGLLFHIGMVEMVSYWKATCSPEIVINPYLLDEEQQEWWRKLYWKGLGEFFYRNGISADYKTFCRFSFAPSAQPLTAEDYQYIPDNQSVIVPIGGGKDSVVTLERLPRDKQRIPFIINPRGATLNCAARAGFNANDEIVILRRPIDKQLLEMNAQEFLNGHTPFSAMLAFYTLWVSYCTNTREIALSNESSASEPTIPGTEINHQYSKSLEFEEDFRTYTRNFMGDCAHYFSFLRPYTELQIAEMFAQHPQYHDIFRSCNVGSKEDKWCCNCSKCLFAYIILAPFLNEEKMVAIFGENLLDKPALQTYFDELTGISAIKPFECVGTLEEVNQALQAIIPHQKDKHLIQHYIKSKKI